MILTFVEINVPNFICDQHMKTFPSELSKLPEWKERVEILLNWKCEKNYYVYFKLRTDLLRLLFHPKTVHRQFVKLDGY